VSKLASPFKRKPPPDDRVEENNPAKAKAKAEAEAAVNAQAVADESQAREKKAAAADAAAKSVAQKAAADERLALAEKRKTAGLEKRKAAAKKLGFDGMPSEAGTPIGNDKRDVAGTAVPALSKPAAESHACFSEHDLAAQLLGELKGEAEEAEALAVEQEADLVRLEADLEGLPDGLEKMKAKKMLRLTGSKSKSSRSHASSLWDQYQAAQAEWPAPEL